MKNNHNRNINKNALKLSKIPYVVYYKDTKSDFYKTKFYNLNFYHKNITNI